MDRQAVYDKVRDHLLTQMKKSRNPDFNHLCAYRGANGLKCALGALIPDELYTHDIEGLTPLEESAGDVFEKALGCHLNQDDKAFLYDLQRVHDGNEPECWKSVLDYFAVTHTLAARGAGKEGENG